MSSYTYAESFTRTHARRLAGRVTTDLRQSHVLYGSPSSSRLAEYRSELEELLADGYVDKYQFGFKRDGMVVWSLRYTVGPDGALTGGAGGVPTGVSVAQASWFTFLSYSYTWDLLSDSAKAAVKKKLPFVRGTGSLPSDAHGYWEKDRTYAAGGVGVQRAVFRSWS
ncbi:HORMA-1 domain-containing protein [Actinoallomurus acaciae]|uniref:Bacterial HORMA domain-containing protein n=1 Tax=Actinoallomurus acaciae TaxID=502577 RepID=A0ABV5Y964_9ACTN